MPESNQLESEKLKEEIKKQARSQLAKWLVGSAVTLIVVALAGWWFYLKTILPDLVGTVPSGAIVAFDLPKGCPAGWEDFDLASGRVIIGVGKSDGLSSRQYRQTGGEEKVTLSKSEMPVHNHKFTGNGYPYGAQSGGDYHSTIALGKGNIQSNYVPAGSIDDAGGGAPHQNMQPFVALHYCKKQ